MIVASILILVIAAFFAYFFFLFLCSLFVDPKREYRVNSRFYRFLLNSATGLVLKLARIRLHVTGIEKVPENTRVLIVGNHRSNFDPIITWYVFRKWDPAFVSKAANFKIPIFGRIIRKCCFMEIDREDPRKALPTLQNAAMLLKKGEVSIGVYPEGTRSKSGELLPFHSAVFKIAQRGNAPVVVAALLGTEKIARNYPFHTSHIYLDVLEVIPAEDVIQQRTKEIGERVCELLKRKLGEEGQTVTCCVGLKAK